MGWDDNIMWNPEKHGLTVVGSLDDPQSCYSFNDLKVWVHDDGRVFYATDSGCSCPVPFEDFNGLEDLEEVTDDTWEPFQYSVDNHCLYANDTMGAERSELLGKVMALLRAQRP